MSRYRLPENSPGNQSNKTDLLFGLATFVILGLLLALGLTLIWAIIRIVSHFT